MVRTTIATISLTLLAFSGCAAPKGYHTSGPAKSYSGYGAESTAGGSTTDGYRPRYRAPSSRGYRRSSTSGRSAPRARYKRYRQPSRSGVTIPPPAPKAPGSVYRHRRRETRRIVRPRPTHRPGLATVFGERVRSRVTFTSFTRARTRPDGVVSIHYNDYQGLVAMTRHLRRRCCGTLPAHRVHAGLTVQLVDAYRRPLRGVQIGGKTIVMGKAGSRYGILVQSYSNRRFEIVASVDGLDVIDGKRANTTKRGYIVAPYGRLYIRGFRTSRYNVAAFRFGSVRNSYAARSTGNTRNVGAVGLAVFSEYRRAYSTTEAIRRLRARPFAQPPR